MSKRLTNKEIIERIKKTHGEKYNYSLVDYKGLSNKIIVIDEVGFKHMIRPDNLISGNYLNLRSVIDKVSYLIYKFKIIHKDKFNYSNFNFNTSKDKINIICSRHGEFQQTIDNHLKGKGCPKCNGKNKTTTEIINDFEKIHGNTYDYSEVRYNGIKNKVIIICKKHGKFKQIAEEHMKGCGCPICKESKGEKKIRNYLKKLGVNFIHQHKFDDCKHILKLPFDFYLPDYNLCIEYNGEQHYKPFKYFGGIKKFKKQKINDKIKVEYCLSNNIKLLIIPFNKEIEDELNFIF